MGDGQCNHYLGNVQSSKRRDACYCWASLRVLQLNRMQKFWRGMGWTAWFCPLLAKNIHISCFQKLLIPLLELLRISQLSSLGWQDLIKIEISFEGFIGRWTGYLTKYKIFHLYIKILKLSMFDFTCKSGLRGSWHDFFIAYFHKVMLAIALSNILHCYFKPCSHYKTSFGICSCSLI